MIGQTTTYETYAKPTTDIYNLEAYEEKGRLFIVANGPSLNETNLDLLIGEESWGMARVHLLYKNTQWRPTRYWWSDHPQNQHDMDDVLFHLEQGYDCWYRRDVCEIIAGEYVPAGGWEPEPQSLPEHVTSWDYCVHHNSALFGDEHWPKDGWHMDTLCKYGSGVNVMLQQGCLEGFNPIYVIGADLGYKAREFGEPDINHFDPTYHSRLVEPSRAQRENEGHQVLYADARRWADAHGIQIVNATIGGDLKTLPRIEYDTLFRSR